MHGLAADPDAVVGNRVEPGVTRTTPPGTLKASVYSADVAGACVIALHTHGDAAQRLLVAPGQPTPPVANRREIEFAKSRKQMTHAKAKARRAEAKHKLQTKREEATRAEHAGTVVRFFSERSGM